MAKRVLACVPDIMLASHVDAALPSLGYDVELLDDLDDLDRALSHGEAALVILDLDSGIATADVVERCRALALPVLAFGRHTEAEQLRAARDAGCAEVVVRSTFVEELPALVQRLTS